MEKKRKASGDVAVPNHVKSLGTRLEFNPEKFNCPLCNKNLFNLFEKAFYAGESFCIAKTNGESLKLYEGAAAAYELIKNPTTFNKTGIVFFKYCPEELDKPKLIHEAHFEILRVIPPGKGL